MRLLCRLGLHGSIPYAVVIPSFRQVGGVEIVGGFACLRPGCSHVDARKRVTA